MEGKDKFPFKITTGKKDNFKGLKTFGCRVWAKQPGRNKAQFRNNTCKGIFLGFLPHTTRVAMYYNVNSHLVKFATHLRYDKGMNDLPIDSIPPNVQHLLRKEDGKRLEAETHFQDTQKLDFHTNPFPNVATHRFTSQYPEHPTMGFHVASDPISNRAFIGDLEQKYLTAMSKTTRSRVLQAYIESINDKKVFTQEEAG